MGDSGGVSALPREVLRWIQSLDLTYSIKHVKRDFCNGFLVAEILSRYYAKDVTMHSFDNGISYKTKKDNWNQLMKIFRRLSFSELISEDECNAIMACEDSAAVDFICKYFELLTKRKVQGLVKKATLGGSKVPGYAQDISLQKVRSALKKNDLMQDDADMESVLKVAASTVDEHSRRLRNERLDNPERFTVPPPRRRVQAAPKDLEDEDEEDESQRVRVMQIEVKQLDRNITHLRASKHTQGLQSASMHERDGHSVMSQSEYGGLEGHSAALGGGLLPPENSVSVLNACIARAMPPHCHPLWSRSAEPIDNFLCGLTLLRSSGLELDPLIVAALQELALSCHSLAEACVVTPKQFWKVADVFCSALHLSPHKSASFNAAVAGFSKLGQAICARDARGSMLLFFDFALPKLREALTNSAYKRVGVMQVMVSFQALDIQTRIQSIRRLQIGAEDQSVFIYCLAVLAASESLASETLLDLYCYYASIGLTAQCPRLRSAAVSILTAMLQHSQALRLVLVQVPQLRTLARQEQWWEVQAQMLSFCGKFMAQVKQLSETAGRHLAQLEAAVDLVLEIIRDLLHPEANRAVKEWGIHIIAASLHFGEPIASIFLEAVVAVDEQRRLFLLGYEEDGATARTLPLGLPSSTGIDFILEPVTPRWSPINLAKAIEITVRLNHLDRLLPEHIEVLNSCVSSALEQSGGELGTDWLDIYSALVDYIFVALCDPSSVDNAVAIVLCFVYHSSLHELVLQETRFVGILRLLYPAEGSGIAKCQAAIEDFFQELFVAKGGRKYDRAVTNLLGQFWRSFPTQFERSNLQKLLNNFTNLMGK